MNLLVRSSGDARRFAAQPLFLFCVSVAALCACWLTAPNGVLAADTIEFLTGAKLEGRVIKIDKEAKKLTFEGTIAGRTIERVYNYSQIHAVTYQGKRFILTEKPAGGTARPGGSSGRTTGGTGRDGGLSDARSVAEVEAIIDAAAAPPDWFDSTPLEYPPTLDLSWPEKPEGGWNNQKNVGQYFWDVVNPNPSRWRSGVRLLHHLLDMHRDDKATRRRIELHLAGVYFNLFQDYARAAHWWRSAGVGRTDGPVVALSECYWRLGSKKLALELLVDPDNRRGPATLHVGMIKLWGDMGEPEKAAKLADAYIKAGGQLFMSYLFVGDAYRNVGKYEKAAEYYQRVLDTPVEGKVGKVDQTKNRAQASLEAIRLFEQSDVSRVPDGTYRDQSRGYEAEVEVEVVVADHRIESVRVVNHREKQFYSSLEDVPQQIVAKQGVKGIEATSHATITGEAIINATAKALARAAEK